MSEWNQLLLYYKRHAIQVNDSTQIASQKLEPRITHSHHPAIYKIYGDKDELKLVGNDDMEAVAMELSGTVTNNLKKENESIVDSIEDLMNRCANINIKKSYSLLL
jgi:hypothetical protein